jgi:trk system potassium uptake protein TrkA
MTMHVVIVGCGRAGTALAARLDAEGDSVCAIDRDGQAQARLPAGFGGEFVTGHGLRRSVLEAAGAERADALVALTASDSLNIVIARVARDVFHVPHAVGRIADFEHVPAASELGLDMVTSVQMTVDRVHRILRHRPLEPDFTFGNGETVLVRAPVPDYLDGRPVTEFAVEGEISVVELTRAGHSAIPGPGTTVRKGDRVSFVVTSASLQRLHSFLGGRWE